MTEGRLKQRLFRVTPPLGARGPAYGGEYYTPTLLSRSLFLRVVLIQGAGLAGCQRPLNAVLLALGIQVPLKLAAYA